MARGVLKRSRVLRHGLLLAAALMLGACGGESAPSATAPAASAATDPVAPTPAQVSDAQPAAPSAAATDDVTATPIADATADTTPDASKTAADSTPPPTPAAPLAPAAPVAPPTGPAPREGTDYTLIDPPQPLGTHPGKVEIVEVFSYTCIHCAQADRLIPAWKARLPAGTEFIYLPMAHGGLEQVARGFYAAQALGKLDSTHSAMFKALAEDRRGGTGTADDIASLYGDLGLDRDTVLATMKSFGVNASIARNMKAVPRWSVESTPTMVVAGKYRVVVTPDRGHQGMLDAALWLAQRELADAGTNSAQ